MARRIYLWLPSLTALALSACGGSESGFFSDVAHGGGSGHAGAPSHAGSSSSAGASSPNSAGSPSSAGALGNEGGAGSAGTSNTGGESEAGGSAGAPGGGASSGGRAGANNSGGAGGRTGSGGSGATGGHAGAQAGTGGVAGSIDDPSCEDLHKLAIDQLDAARACNLALSSLQCTGTVMNTCNCEVPVRRDDSAETKAYLATMKKVEQKNCSWFCTKQACQQVLDAECKPSGSGSTGVCTAVNDVPGPGHGSF